ncbi:hypothetical protein GGS24DRAFT_490527 [Hypoxylon argillaceum]|nr:hypothetical protein GGS24DRAFT_490527 [Hypoxylon argillaceum]
MEDSDGIFIEKMSLDLDDFLIFDFEGMGSAFGEQVKMVDADLSEQLSDMKTELKKAKKQSAIDISSLKAVFDAEKAALQRAFDTDKAKLQDEFQAREAELQRDMQDKARDLEQQLDDATTELSQVKKSNESAENQRESMTGVDSTLHQEIDKVSQQRDNIETKFQELEKEAYASNQALQDAKRANEKQAGSIATLKSENTHLTAELAKLLQTVVPKNIQLEAELSSLRDAAGVAASRDVASSELARVRELMGRELSDAEKNIHNLHIKIAGLESRVESMTAENNELDESISELRQRLLRESKELQGARQDNERQRGDIDMLRNRIGAAEDEASALKSDLSAAESGLESYQTALKDELRESANAAEAKGRLEAFETMTKTTAREEAKQFSDSYDGARAELEKANRDLATANFQSARQARALRTETEQVEKLKADLEKAVQRELEYDPDRLYQQLDGQREALQMEKVEHVASVDRLTGDVQMCQNEIQRLEEEINKRDDGLRQCIDVIADLEIRYEEEQDAIATAEKKVQDSKTQAAQIRASMAEERNQRAQMKTRLDAEISNHTATRNRLRQELGAKGALEREVRDLKTHVSQLSDSVFDDRKSRAKKTRSRSSLSTSNPADPEQALVQERARADEYGTKLDRANQQFSQEQHKLSQANAALREAQERAASMESELGQKKGELQQHKTALSNQQARIRVLERASKHADCVTLDSVKELVGSYERLYDFALRTCSQKAWLRKAHYPDGFSWVDGRQAVGFRREQFPKSRRPKKK